MAKRKVNKSQEIREYVTSNRAASAKAVVEAMQEKGIKVTAAMVANVKSKAGLTRGRRGRPRKAANLNGSVRRVGRPAKNNSDVALEALIEAKKFVAKVGSTQQALDVIRALEKLDSIAT
jgi:arginine repressor